MKINTLEEDKNLDSFRPQETTEDLSLMTSYPEMIILLNFFIKQEETEREEIKSKYSRTLCKSHIFGYFLQ